jgi:hypothetical protein
VGLGLFQDQMPLQLKLYNVMPKVAFLAKPAIAPALGPTLALELAPAMLGSSVSLKLRTATHP